MKKCIFVFATLVVFSAGTVFTGCESAEKKSADANENLRDAKTGLRKAEDEATAATQKALDAADWKLFKAESETKIKANDDLIVELKAKKKSSDKSLNAAYSKSIENLEINNNDLKARMAAYEKGQTDWQAFKSEFNRDMDELGKALKDLVVNSKK
jgi:hypothetical protein